ncbi:hypothetical protein Acr_00g0009750 [Actinidia rufa]|uniref:Uncharacterized protein n=1 Tax=Actinidia rufa TaxID=165716 RepID=A0A7J0DAN2_9ERIC|nr:hypothetical protein Acr_00g0009750 [Actinidia rufa]
MDSWDVSWLGAEIKLTAMVHPIFPLKTDAELVSASTCEFRFLPTCSILTALNSAIFCSINEHLPCRGEINLSWFYGNLWNLSDFFGDCFCTLGFFFNNLVIPCVDWIPTDFAPKLSSPLCVDASLSCSGLTARGSPHLGGAKFDELEQYGSHSLHPVQPILANNCNYTEKLKLFEEVIIHLLDKAFHVHQDPFHVVIVDPELNDQRVNMRMLDPFQSQDWGDLDPYHVNDSQGKVFFEGVVYFFVAPIKPGVRSGIDFLCSGLFLVNKLFQVSISDKLIKKSLQSSAVLGSMPLLLVIGTLPPLIAPFGVPSHGIGLLEGLAEIHIGGSLAGRYSSFARCHRFTIASAVQANMGSTLPSVSTFSRNNRPYFCLEADLATLWASTNSLSPVSRSSGSMRGLLMSFLTAGTMRGKKSRIDTCGGPTAVWVAAGLAGSQSSCCRRLNPGMGVVKRNFDVQVTFCFPDIPPGSPLTITPRPSSGAVIPPNLLNSDNSEVTVTLAQTVSVFGSGCNEL